MTLKDYHRYFSDKVAAYYPAGEAAAITRIVWEDLAGMSAMDLRIKGNTPIAAEQVATMEDVLRRLQQQEPVQYIVGSAVFGGVRLGVNPSVLIPRPETEELAQWIINDEKRYPPGPHILDVGTGSGCLAIALKHKIPSATMTAIDLSAAALETAISNAASQHQSIHFRQLDFLDTEAREELPRVHVIVSNPPYIPQAESELLDANVKMYEPATALFVPDDDPLLFYKALADFGSTHLLPQGALYVETHERYAVATARLFSEFFSAVKIKTDLQGRERMIRAANF